MPFAAFIPLIATAVSGIINAIQSRQNIKKQQSANLALSQQEFAQNQNAMRELNQYNDPTAQMNRLAGAGLNPNLIYGSGASGAAGNQPSASKYAGRETNVAMPVPVNVPEMIGAYQEFQLKQATIDNVKANTENVRERTETEPVSRLLKELMGAKTSAERERILQLLPLEGELKKTQAEATRVSTERNRFGLKLDTAKLANLRQDELIKLLVREQKGQDIKLGGIKGQGMLIDNQKKQADLIYARYKNEWMKAGFTTSDDLGFRFIVRMLNESGLIDEIGPFLKDLTQKIKDWKPGYMK